MVPEQTTGPAQQPIRADLGRPETPEERAARKAQNSRDYRQSKTPNNLVVALVASLVVVLVLVLLVVRDDQPGPAAVDYAAVAAEAQPGAPTPLAVPVLPPGWKANSASLSPASEQGFTWYIGFITPKEQFIGLEQGIDASNGWLQDLLGREPATGEVTIEGVDWQVYDRRGSDEPGNFAYSLATEVGDTSYLLHGTAEKGEFGSLAAAIATELNER